MEMVMDMWRVNPSRCDPPEQWVPREPASGCIGWLVAQPVDERRFMVAGGQFDVDAFDDASVGTFFPLTKDGYRAAHVALRRRLRQLGHVRQEGSTVDIFCNDPLPLPA
jgi:hypothetical protein